MRAHSTTGKPSGWRRPRAAEKSFPSASLLIISICLSAFAASPEITRITPLAVVPGKTNLLTISGSNLDSVNRFSCFFGPNGRRVTNSTDDVTFEVFCPVGRTGIEAVQVSGPDGVSNFQLVLIDALATHTNDGSRELIPPVAVDGTFKSEKIEYYQFSAKAGEELSIEVLAHRIGSQGDPVLRILDTEGREVAFCDDEEASVWRDPRLRFRAPKTGNYTLAMYDVGYGGGARYFYRLRIGDFPIVANSYPLRHWGETGTQELTYVFTNTSPANPEPSRWFCEFPMMMELEPNEEGAAAREFGIPMVLNGRFESGTDRDRFRFTVEKDQKLAFEARTRSLESPCDVRLRILKPNGELVVENSGTNEDEPSFSHLFTEAGTYYLEVSELTGTAPKNAAYQIKVTHWSPSFSLSSEINKLEVEPEGSAKLKILCQRDGYEGEIELSSNVTLENNVIPAKAKEAEITVKFPEAGRDLIDFTIEGKATNGVVRSVSARPALRKMFPLMLNPPPELERRFVLGLKAK